MNAQIVKRVTTYRFGAYWTTGPRLGPVKLRALQVVFNGTRRGNDFATFVKVADIFGHKLTMNLERLP